MALALAVARHPRLRFCGARRPTTAAPSTLPALPNGARPLRAPCSRPRTRATSSRPPLPVPLVTGSGTGTLVNEAASGVYGELQAGSFLHGRRLRPQRTRPCVQARVRSTPPARRDPGELVRDTHAVCDAGHKSHAIDSAARPWQTCL